MSARVREKQYLCTALNYYLKAYEMKKSTLFLLSFLFIGITNVFCQIAQPDPISPTIGGVSRSISGEDGRNRVVTKKFVRHFDRRGRLIRHEEYLNGSLVSEFVCNYSGSRAYPVFRSNKRVLNKNRNKDYPEVIGRVIRKEHYATGEVKSVDSIVCLRFPKAQNIKFRDVPEDKAFSQSSKKSFGPEYYLPGSLIPANYSAKIRSEYSKGKKNNLTAYKKQSRSHLARKHKSA